MRSPRPTPRALLVVACVLVVGCSGAATTSAANSSRVPADDVPSVAAASVSPSRDARPSSLEPSEGFDVTPVTMSDGERVVELSVYVADARELRSRGLSGRDALPADAGMLFVFDETREVTFWMKDTTIPLSIAFVDDGGTITEVVDMDPCRSAVCPRYPSSDAVRYAIEVNEGWFARNGVDAGWTVTGPEIGGQNR